MHPEDASNMKECPRCKKKLSDEASFCFVCGALEIEEPTVQVIISADLPQVAEKTAMPHIEDKVEIVEVTPEELQTLDTFIESYNRVNPERVKEIYRFLTNWNCENLEMKYYDAVIGTAYFMESEKSDFLSAKINNSVYITPPFFKTFSQKRRLMLEKCFAIEASEKIETGNIYQVVAPATGVITPNYGLRLLKKGKIQVLSPLTREEAQEKESIKAKEERGAKEEVVGLDSSVYSVRLPKNGKIEPRRREVSSAPSRESIPIMTRELKIWIMLMPALPIAVLGILAVVAHKMGIASIIFATSCSITFLGRFLLKRKRWALIAYKVLLILTGLFWFLTPFTGLVKGVIDIYRFPQEPAMFASVLAGIVISAVVLFSKLPKIKPLLYSEKIKAKSKKKCHNHSEKDATAACRYCGRYLCSDCLRKSGDYYCCKNEDECLAYQDHPTSPDQKKYEKEEKEVDHPLVDQDTPKPMRVRRSIKYFTYIVLSLLFIIKVVPSVINKEQSHETASAPPPVEIQVPAPKPAPLPKTSPAAEDWAVSVKNDRQLETEKAISSIKAKLEEERRKRNERINRDLGFAKNYLNMGQYESAIKKSNEVLKIDPDNFEAKDLIKTAEEIRQEINVAKVFLDNDWYDDAIKTLEKLREKNPGNKAILAAIERAKEAKEAEGEILGD